MVALVSGLLVQLARLGVVLRHAKTFGEKQAEVSHGNRIVVVCARLDYPRAAVATSALEIRANLLRTGRYLSIIPEFWLQLPGRHPFIKKLAVHLPITGAPIGIITLKNRKPSPVVQLFIDCAREVARPLAEQNA